MEELTEAIKEFELAADAILEMTPADHKQIRHNHSRAIREYVEFYEKNSPLQRTDEWLKRKKTTIGGSSIAVIIGANHYESVEKLVLERVGLAAGFTSNEATAWGNMFENVIQEIVERRYDTKIIGTEIYIEDGDIGVSPDGIGAITTADVVTNEVLFEFKCPYKRLPIEKRPPPYYVPQIQIGLEHIIDGSGQPLLDYGVLVEGVFRLCTLDQLADGLAHNTQLGPTPAKPRLLAMGFLGITGPLKTAQAPASAEASKAADDLDRYYNGAKRFYGGQHNDYSACDLGDSGVAFYKALTTAANLGIIVPAPWRSRPIIRADDLAVSMTGGSDSPSTPESSKQSNGAAVLVGREMKRFRQYCRENDLDVYGVLPWKLLDIKYHKIERRNPPIKEEFGEKIASTVNIIKECLATPLDQRYIVYDTYFAETNGGFID